MQPRLKTVTVDIPNALASKGAALQAELGRIAAGYSPATLASSLSIEDQVVTHAILSGGHAIAPARPFLS